jgi:hypothetical protein
MSQHDYVIDNQSGSLFRTDLNNALAAAVSLNSGASAPSTTYAYMPWADTTSGWLKIRNSANTDWVKLFLLSNAAASRRPVLSKGSNYTVAETDHGSLIRCTAAITLTLLAVATAGDGFHFSIINDYSAAITIDPNASETINGATTITVPAAGSVDVFCTGSVWYMTSGVSVRTYISTAIPVAGDMADGELWFTREA